MCILFINLFFSFFCRLRLKSSTKHNYYPEVCKKYVIIIIIWLNKIIKLLSVMAYLNYKKNCLQLFREVRIMKMLDHPNIGNKNR